MEFQCFEVKPEDDSKETTEWSYDDKPSTSMFSVSWWGNFLHWCSLCTALMLWCLYCLSTQVSVNDTRLNYDKSVRLSVHLSLDKYVKVKCMSKPLMPISQRWSPVPWPSVSQIYKTTNTGPVRCVLCLFTSQFSPSAKLYCLMTQTVECKNLPNVNTSPIHTRYIMSHHPSVCPLVHCETLW